MCRIANLLHRIINLLHRTLLLTGIGIWTSDTQPTEQDHDGNVRISQKKNGSLRLPITRRRVADNQEILNEFNDIYNVRNTSY